ncbi:MAG: hypothetical protein IPM55_21615 [Acidobacteria bacterium]|nr:hypothetical protein [Acidobacteriota bacterium]
MEAKVATSLPVNNPYSQTTETISEWITDGAIGRVREVHNWSSRPYWPQGVERPKETQPAPDNLNWEMWVGPAPMRPYNKAYCPFVWRGWYDFGCGSFGDNKAATVSPGFQNPRLTPPTGFKHVRANLTRRLSTGLDRSSGLPGPRKASGGTHDLV